MDRDEIVRISRLAYTGGLSDNDVASVIMQYCLEHNKPLDKIQMFISILLRTSFVSSYFNTALEYFKKKFSICELLEKIDMRQSFEGRKVLLVY